MKQSFKLPFHSNGNWKLLGRTLARSIASKSPSKSKSNITSLNLNLPNFKNFELSTKNICQIENFIKKVADFDGLYKWQAENRKTSPLFKLQDGPPYANGNIHIGHMVNKVLKDICLRYKLISGYRVEYKPGWDCHGLPIELAALKNFFTKEKSSFKTDDPVAVRNLAATHAHQFMSQQMDAFAQLDLMCDWTHTYKTIDPDYMCCELDLFYTLYERKLIYRDYMPVYWSVSSQTALAESELEYKPDHLSNALFVAFEIIQIPDRIRLLLKPNQKLYAPIWTTTYWSLPCNKAIAYNPNLKYSLLSVNEKVFIVENELMNKLRQTVPMFQNSSVIEGASFDGRVLEGSKYRSPFVKNINQTQPLLPSDHVTTKQGTGLVHVAPALGHDDFKLGLKYGLENRCVIDEHGRFTSDEEILNKHRLNGLNVFHESTLNKIKAILGDSLLHQHEHEHAYPFDWRTGKPCLIRSSMQWFIDTNQLRDDAIRALNEVRVRPVNTVNSMLASLSTRPYWCISRQRAWGLPIPCVYERGENEPTREAANKKPILNAQFIDLFKELLQKEGNANFWWTSKYNEQYEKVLGIPKEKFERSKSKDILDIWFDSGSAFMASSSSSSVADLYCEGIDQFTGWFQSSLLLYIALERRSPYRSLLVHGFVVDENDRKMSKSLGNVIEPKEIISGTKKTLGLGLDGVRFWVAHEYHKPQIQIGPNIINKFRDRAFGIRKDVRLMTGNLRDFESESRLDYDKLLPFDKYIMLQLAQTIERVIANYEDMNISKALNSLELFITTKVSSYYINSIKDRLYCESIKSHKRLSAQTALSHVLVNTLLMLAPIMPHLAEEAFYYSPYLIKSHPNGLFRSNLKLSADPKWSNPDIERLFSLVNQMRDEFNEIATGNTAVYNVDLECNKRVLDLMGADDPSGWLHEVFGSADVKMSEKANVDGNDAARYNMKVSRIDQGTKFACARCRRHTSDKRDGFCHRCQDVMKHVQ